jgi:uncharacterized membrane protein
MKRFGKFLLSSLVAGVLIVAPLYLAILLMLKAMKSLAGLVKPFVGLLPEWLPAERLLSLLLILFICLFIGAAARTRAGRSVMEKLERSFFERIPGYAVIRSLTQRLAGKGDETQWKPALVEIEDALVPGFIIEEFADGRYTVFIPSVPTPLAGAVYVLARERVHPVNVPFTQAIRAISRWGSGCDELVAAMEPGGQPPRALA